MSLKTYPRYFIIENERTSTGTTFLVPLAIVIAGAFVAGAIWYSSATNAPTGNNQANAVANNAQPVTTGLTQQPSITNVTPITAEDHVIGNPNAPVKIVEYSDIECPYCKVFHNTMNRIMDVYGKDGKVAWVYRHFPIQNLHSKAVAEAVATECVATLAGEDAFWRYLDNIFEVTPSNNGLDLALLPGMAEDVGISRQQFDGCISNADIYQNKISNSIQNAVLSGARGTPYSVILSSDGTPKSAIDGAETFEMVQAKIEAILNAE